MFDEQLMKVVYVQQPVPPRKKPRRSTSSINIRANRVFPRPKFTCIDEVYSTGPLSNISSAQTSVTAASSSQILKVEEPNQKRHWQRWLLVIVVIIIIFSIIAIIVLLAVFLTRWPIVGWTSFDVKYDLSTKSGENLFIFSHHIRFQQDFRSS